MEDVECSEMNEKSIFSFLFFDLWPFLYSKYGQFLMNFHHNLKEKIRIFFFLFFIHFKMFLNYLDQKMKTALYEEVGGWSVDRFLGNTLLFKLTKFEAGFFSVKHFLYLIFILLGWNFIPEVSLSW